MTHEELKNKVRALISKAKTQEAIDEIATWAHENNQEQFKSDISLIKGDWTDFSREKTLGLLSPSEASLRQNQLVDKVLSLVNGIEDPQQPIFEKETSEPKIEVKSEPKSSSTQIIEALKILMLTANPTNKRKLELSKEQGDIDYKLQDKRDKLQLTTKRSVNISEFKEFIEKNKPNILHFSGHGEGVDSEAGIVVHNDDKNADELITLDGLDALFEYLTTDCHIKLDAVVLNACFSEEQAKVISKYVPIVMGTNVSIGDTLAIAFSTGFYFKLAESEQVDYELAFKSGRTQAVLKGASRANFVLFKNGSKVEF